MRTAGGTRWEPGLIVLDALDEVGSAAMRGRVVGEVDTFVGRRNSKSPRHLVSLLYKPEDSAGL